MTSNFVGADWNDLEVVPAIQYPSAEWGAGKAGETSTVALVENFNVRISTPGDIMDSMNNHNMGNVEFPARYTVDITVFPKGEGFNLLNRIQAGRRYFDLILAPAANFDATMIPSGEVGRSVGADWGPRKYIFTGCKVRDKSERYAVRSKPTVTFSCTALRYALPDQTSTGGSVFQVGTGWQEVQVTDKKLGLPEAGTL